MMQRETLEIEQGGEAVTATYIHRLLDKTKCETLVQGCRAKYCYQGNQPTQGIDIRLGRRVIAAAQFGKIWRKADGTPIARHNSYNDFVGELILPQVPRRGLPEMQDAIPGRTKQSICFRPKRMKCV